MKRFTPALAVFAFVMAVRADVRAQTPATIEVQPASVTLTPARAQLTAGQTAQFKAVVRDSSGAVITKDVSWAIGPFEVAAVDKSGTVRTFRAGSAQLLAIARAGVIAHA